MLQVPLKEEIEMLQRKQIIVPLGMEKILEWCNSFVLVPKTNGNVRLCLDPARHNKALVRSVQRGLTLNDILLRLTVIKYITLTDASSGYCI